MALYEELKADSLLLTDEDASQKANSLGARTINLADVGREAFRTGTFNAQELLTYASNFLEQGILVTKYMETLKEEAERWLSKRT
jgi:predicted nucleic acid-binding protein